MFDIPLDYYRIFCKVAACKNMTKAASELFITQPAVSMAIRELEKRLNGKLLTRTQKGVTLTYEGRVLYESISTALDIIALAEKKYTDVKSLWQGEINIGASDTLTDKFLLRYIERFSKQYPNISIKITNRISSETVTLLQDGLVDVGFVNLPVVCGKNIEVVHCMDIHDELVGGEKFYELSKRGVNINELAGYPLVLLEKSSATRTFLDNYAKLHNVQLDPVLELGSSDLLIKFAKINFGLTFVIREFAKEYVDGEQLFSIPLTPNPKKRHIGMLKMKNADFSDATRAFTDMILQTGV